MSWIVITNALTVVVIPPLSSWTTHRLLRGSRDAFYFGWIASAIVGGVYLLADGEHPVWTVIAGANAGLAAYLWWRKRKRRKRAPRAYGAKSRALVDAVVRKMRQERQPRRVLRPLPNPG